MKSGFTEINGKKVFISDLEYLYNYINEKNEKIVVFEYEGKKIEKKIINEPIP